MARTAAAEFPHLVLDVSRQAVDKIVTELGEHPLTLELVARSNTVQVLHQGTRIGEADPYDAADLARRVPMLEQGVPEGGSGAMCELEADIAIDADFDDVMQAVIDGHGTPSDTRPQA